MRDDPGPRPGRRVLRKRVVDSVDPLWIECEIHSLPSVVAGKQRKQIVTMNVYLLRAPDVVNGPEWEKAGPGIGPPISTFFVGVMKDFAKARELDRIPWLVEISSQNDRRSGESVLTNRLKDSFHGGFNILNRMGMKVDSHKEKVTLRCMHVAAKCCAGLGGNRSQSTEWKFGYEDEFIQRTYVTFRKPHPRRVKHVI